jgi:hypothetical protein
MLEGKMKIGDKLPNGQTINEDTIINYSKCPKCNSPTVLFCNEDLSPHACDKEVCIKCQWVFEYI